MKRMLTATALALALLGGAAVAYSAIVSDGVTDQTFVSGGGRFGPGTFPSGFTIAQPRDFSVDAHVDKKGAKVTGVFYYGNNSGPSLIADGNVTCVSIEGNRSAVGGVVSSGAFAGYGFVVFLTDNGTPASAMRDQSSPVFLDVLASTDWPAGFPTVCPTPSSGYNTIGYLDIHSGDVIVHPRTD